MKSKTFLFFIFTASLIFGCKKENLNFKNLTGTWELRSSNSGLFNIVTNYPIGNGAIIKYTSNTFQRFENGQLIESGSYSIQKDSIKIFHKIGDKIIYNNENEMFFAVNDTSLFFFQDAYDTGSTTYSKIKK